MTLFLIGMSGVFTGALIVILAFYLLLKYQDQKEKKRRVIEQKAKEIETLIHLNQKMVEILEKRVLLMDKYVSFDAFDDCYITVNKNTIPNEPLSPFVTSGVRIGTAAVTTRGLKEEDCDKIAEYITLVLNDYEGNKDKVRAGVEEICKKYPLYED